MPSLILINGNPGMGKSTLAQRYADEHPLTLNLDVDRIWHMIGQWQAQIPESDDLKFEYSALLAGQHLSKGHDVIVSDVFQSVDEIYKFERIAETHHAVFREFVLLSSADDAIERHKSRARAMGWPDGFRPGGVLDTNGRELKLRSMYDNVLGVIAKRPDTIVVDSTYGEADATYNAILAHCNP